MKNIKKKKLTNRYIKRRRAFLRDISLNVFLSFLLSSLVIFLLSST